MPAGYSDCEVVTVNTLDSVTPSATDLANIPFSGCRLGRDAVNFGKICMFPPAFAGGTFKLRMGYGVTDSVADFVTPRAVAEIVTVPVLPATVFTVTVAILEPGAITTLAGRAAIDVSLDLSVTDRPAIPVGPSRVTVSVVLKPPFRDATFRLHVEIEAGRTVTTVLRRIPPSSA